MTNLIKIEQKSDVKETIQEFLELSEDVDCFVVVYLRKDGRPAMMGSSCSQMERSFLHKFFGWCLDRWFDRGSE